MVARVTGGDIALLEGVAECGHGFNASWDECDGREGLADLDVQERFDLQFRLAKRIYSRNPISADPLVRSCDLGPRAREPCRDFSAEGLARGWPQFVAKAGPGPTLHLGLGAQAGEPRISRVVAEAGFKRFRRATQTPFNIVYEARP